jgi:CrcB protein
MIKILLAIGSGSFAGGIARFLLSKYLTANIISSYPHGTFWVNVIGCFFIGIFYGLFEKMGDFNHTLRLFLTVGFCGGFTTFSTFANENMALLRDGNYFIFALYTGLSVFVGLLAVGLGNFIIKIL